MGLWGGGGAKRRAVISRETKNESQVATKTAEAKHKKSQVQNQWKLKEQKSEIYHRETLEKIQVNAGWHHGETRRKTAPTDKDVRENKDYVHWHTNEGIRNR